MPLLAASARTSLVLGQRLDLAGWRSGAALQR